jgi:hypothetical protein
VSSPYRTLVVSSPGRVEALARWMLDERFANGKTSSEEYQRRRRDIYRRMREDVQEREEG